MKNKFLFCNDFIFLRILSIQFLFLIYHKNAKIDILNVCFKGKIYFIESNFLEKSSPIKPLKNKTYKWIFPLRSQATMAQKSLTIQPFWALYNLSCRLFCCSFMCQLYRFVCYCLFHFSLFSFVYFNKFDFITFN